MNDAKLDELYENREQDEVPEVAPPTDEEMEAMATYFNAEASNVA